MTIQGDGGYIFICVVCFILGFLLGGARKQEKDKK